MLKAYDTQALTQQAQQTPPMPTTIALLATPPSTLDELRLIVTTLADDVMESTTRPSAEEIVLRLQAVARELVIWDACVKQVQQTQVQQQVLQGDPNAPTLSFAGAGAGTGVVPDPQKPDVVDAEADMPVPGSQS